MCEIIITKAAAQSYKDFDLGAFIHKDARIMDIYTKVAIHISRELKKQLELEQVDISGCALVFSTATGPITSVKEFNQILNESGHRGINPSRFPNVMLSTCLSRAAAELDIHGPTIAMYSNKNIEPLRCAVLQIISGTCDTAILINNNDGKYCFGILIQKRDEKNMCFKRVSINNCSVLKMEGNYICE